MQIVKSVSDSPADAQRCKLYSDYIFIDDFHLLGEPHVADENHQKNVEEV